MLSAENECNVCNSRNCLHHISQSKSSRRNLEKETGWKPWGIIAFWLASLGLFICLPSDGISYSEWATSNEEGHGVQQPGPKDKEECSQSQSHPVSSLIRTSHRVPDWNILSASRKAFPDLRTVQLQWCLTVHMPLLPGLRRQG